MSPNSKNGSPRTKPGNLCRSITETVVGAFAETCDVV